MVPVATSTATSLAPSSTSSQSSSSQTSRPQLTAQQIDAELSSIIANLPSINKRLREADPEEIVEWAIDTLGHLGLYQTTAFGLTGCVTLDQVARISEDRAKKQGIPKKHLVPLIFLDTLYHFPQTTDLAARAARHYDAEMHVYRPEGCIDTREFEAKHGSSLWTRDEDLYDYLVKVEPARRAYEELGVRAVFTGRRRSQGADRASLQAVEADETGLIKVNPFLNWSFEEVDTYVRTNAVPYNELLDMGYKSIGDWHSTSLPVPGQGDSGERSGRWKDKAGKTECGLHVDYFKFKRIAAKKLREAELAAKDDALDEQDVDMDETEGQKTPRQTDESSAAANIARKTRELSPGLKNVLRDNVVVRSAQ